MGFQKVKNRRRAHNWSGQTYSKEQGFRWKIVGFRHFRPVRGGRGESPTELTCFSRSKIMFAGKFWEGAREMLRQKMRMPDVDPAIAQAHATAPAPFPTALRSAAFSIGAIVLCIVLSSGWSQLSKLGRGQQVAISATQ
jgi:hypothetical protein